MAIMTGNEAIEMAVVAQLPGTMPCVLNKYADPTEGAREGLTIEEAREIAKEDPGLIWADVYVHVDSNATNWRIRNTSTAVVLGDYPGATAAEALDAMAKDAGYPSYASACEEVPVAEGEIEVTPADTFADLMAETGAFPGRSGR